ncbi:hypothetical protein HQN90_37730 [Paenibacillus alba]|uniref:hypothetical protein n=1 Tax=Paenibacillus alba TaxID=1197127 RepID=UPI001565D729|nr:hypothetical protein [Paenibacillus alba]NQX71817.1 hypothetical protein [Paenibacillus alba]
MEEMLNEVTKILKTLQANMERQKKYYDYPFTQSCDHFYKLILLQQKMETWNQCKSLIEKYKKSRMGPIMKRRSEDFESMIELQKRGMPGFITKVTEAGMLEYMKSLEWIIEELERQLYCLSITKSMECFR